MDFTKSADLSFKVFNATGPLTSISDSSFETEFCSELFTEREAYNISEIFRIV